MEKRTSPSAKTTAAYISCIAPTRGTSRSRAGDHDPGRGMPRRQALRVSPGERQGGCLEEAGGRSGSGQGLEDAAPRHRGAGDSERLQRPRGLRLGAAGGRLGARGCSRPGRMQGATLVDHGRKPDSTVSWRILAPCLRSAHARRPPGGSSAGERAYERRHPG